MIIKNEPPPNYDQVLAIFPKTPNTYYCWGETVYNPDGNPIPEDILFHESIHSKQQEGNPERWWNRYITDKAFRLSEEKEAYLAQYQFLRPYINAKTAKEALEDFAKNLSSPLYQLNMDFNRTYTELRHGISN